MNEVDGVVAAAVVEAAEPGENLRVADWHHRDCYSGSVAVVVAAAAAGIVVGEWRPDQNLQHCRF